jgi:hypothetical protein
MHPTGSRFRVIDQAFFSLDHGKSLPIELLQMARKARRCCTEF